MPPSEAGSAAPRHQEYCDLWTMTLFECAPLLHIATRYARQAAALRQQLRATGVKDNAYWAAEMLDCIFSAEKIVGQRSREHGTATPTTTTTSTRDLIWNVLVVEFPKIRDTLRKCLGI